MRLLIKTNGVQFRVAGAAKPKKDYKDKERLAPKRVGAPESVRIAADAAKGGKADSARSTRAARRQA